MKKTIAVTGSSGFIGKHLVDILTNEDFHVIPMDISSGFNLLVPENVKLIPPFDFIIHLAARSFVPLSFQNPYLFYYENYVLTLNVLELARKYNAKVIYFSSYLYGNPEYLPIDESHPVFPHNPYAQSKLICEKLCEGYNRDFNLSVVIFRPFNIYGPGQDPSFLVSKLLCQLKQGDVYLDDPEPRRDFIHVKDVIKAILCSIEKDLSGLHLFNLGTGLSLTIREVSELIQSLLITNNKILFTNRKRQGEVEETVADITRAKILLDWEPVFDIQNGIKSML